MLSGPKVSVRKADMLWESEQTHPKLTRELKVPPKPRRWFIGEQHFQAGFFLTARLLWYCMFIFHWGLWFAVEQVTFTELDSLCCNFPCLELPPGVCFGQHKQLYESKQFKSKAKLNRLFVHYYTLPYLQISCCHICGSVTRKLPLCVLCCMQFSYRKWRCTDKDRNICNLLLFLCSVVCFLTLSRTLSGLGPKCRELSTFTSKPKYVFFIFWPKFLFERFCFFNASFYIFPQTEIPW